MNVVEYAIAVVSPKWAASRAMSRRVLRTYQGAEANRLTNNKKPKNQAADQELMGPFGADALRAWSRALVRDNAYAWGVVDTIVSSVVGNGITAQSTYETPEGDDIEDTNDIRDEMFAEWCEVCDINGQLTFAEIQALVQREIVEAGEVLVRFVKTKGKEADGISRPVPLAIELIEADRLAVDHDTYTAVFSRTNGRRIVRGVELDEFGKPLAYWIYRDHPSAPYSLQREPDRIPAAEIRHLFRQDRVGQSRGVTWFAPVMSWLRDLGVYVDNEIQASAVAACFGVAIKTDSTYPGLNAPEGEDAVDSNGNMMEYLEPAMIHRLKTGESIETINPGRPNSASEPWINLMLRGIAVGTGLSYEIVARDYSKTNYSSSRSSQLEDRRRFRRWQQYLLNNLCQPVWDEFCNAAALVDAEAFPTSSELLESRRKLTPVEWQTPEWEWVDPTSEQAAAKDSIQSFMSTYQDELGARGRSWRATFYQASKEQKLRMQLGLMTTEERTQQMMDAQTGGGQPAEPQAAQAEPTQAGSGEWMGLSRMQWNRNRKALSDVLSGLEDGSMSAALASAQLAMIGMSQQNIDAIIEDASDGTVDTPLPPDTEAVADGA